jgi:hypothetical protein
MSASRTASQNGERAFSSWSMNLPCFHVSAVSDRLPELLDAKALRLELGVTRAAAEAIMRHRSCRSRG